MQERAGGENGLIIMLGRYDDKLVLTDDGWSFTERRLTVYKFAATDAGELGPMRGASRIAMTPSCQN